MIMSSFIVPLVLTIAVESLVGLAMGYRGKSFLLVLALINIATNPLLNYILYIGSMLGISRDALLLPLEIAVIFSEWKLLCYAFPKETRSFFILSGVMNVTSYIIGAYIIFLFNL